MGGRGSADSLVVVLTAYLEGRPPRSLPPPVLETKLSLPVRPFPAPTCWEDVECSVPDAGTRIPQV